MNAQLARIVAHVNRVRAESGIEPHTKGRSEPSGFAYDEFELLLDFQLLHTKNGLGAWAALEDETILQSVYDVVQRRENHPRPDSPS